MTDSEADEEVNFFDEPTPEAGDGCAPDAPPWKVLVVDDDDQIQLVTKMTLRRFTFRGRPVKLISALSGAAARVILQNETDIALAFVDVVMETEHSGLDLVRHIRNELGNRAIRLIMRTGQPGQAPERTVIVDYEVEDYKSKTDLTSEKLVAAVVSSLRAYDYIMSLQKITEELEARVRMRTAELERMALVDPLTGAGNRRHLDARAEAEIVFAHRERRPLAVIVFDIDHFKQINDTHGHAAGDEALRNVVELTKQLLRSDDFLARVGGEEFAILLPGCQEKAATHTAERIRNAFVNTPISIPGCQLPVTASFGISLLRHDEETITPALQRADEAMYEAKRRGRNMVLVAHHTPS